MEQFVAGLIKLIKAVQKGDEEIYEAWWRTFQNWL